MLEETIMKWKCSSNQMSKQETEERNIEKNPYQKKNKKIWKEPDNKISSLLTDPTIF